MSAPNSPRSDAGVAQATVVTVTAAAAAKDNANAPPNAKLLAYLNVMEELKSCEEGKVALLLKVKDLQERLDIKTADSKDIYYYLNQKCDDSYNMIAILEEQLSAEQLDRENDEKGYEERIASLTAQLKHEGEISHQTISALEDKLMGFSTFHETKLRLESRISELEATLADEREANTRDVEALELRYTKERDRWAKDKAASLESLRHEMEHSLQSRMPKAVQKTLLINTLIREELRQQSTTAMGILDRDNTIQAENKAAKLELSLAQDNTKEMENRLVACHKAIRQLQEQLSRALAERDQQAEEHSVVLRLKDASLTQLQALLASAEAQLADRRDEAAKQEVWAFLAESYLAHQGPRSFDVAVPATASGDADAHADAHADAAATNSTTTPATADDDQSLGSLEVNLATTDEAWFASSADEDLALARELYTQHPMTQRPLPPPPDWTVRHEKVLVFLIRDLLQRYPAKFSALVTQAEGIGHGGHSALHRLGDNGSFALTQHDDGLGAALLFGSPKGTTRRSAGEPSSADGSKPQSRPRSQSPSRGSPSSPSSRATSREAQEAMQVFRSIFLPPGLVRGNTNTNTGSHSDSDAALLQNSGGNDSDDTSSVGGGSVSVPDLSRRSLNNNNNNAKGSRRSRPKGRSVFATSGPASVSSYSDRDRDNFSTTSTVSSATASATASASASASVSNSSSASHAVNFGVYRGSPKQRPAQLNMRGLISEKIMQADPASLDSIGWKGGSSLGRGGVGAPSVQIPGRGGSALSLTLAGKHVTGSVYSPSMTQTSPSTNYRLSPGGKGKGTGTGTGTGAQQQLDSGVALSQSFMGADSDSHSNSQRPGSGKSNSHSHSQSHSSYSLNQQRKNLTSPPSPPPPLPLHVLNTTGGCDRADSGMLSPASTISISPRGFGADLEDESKFDTPKGTAVPAARGVVRFAADVQ